MRYWGERNWISKMQLVTRELTTWPLSFFGTFFGHRKSNKFREQLVQRSSSVTITWVPILFCAHKCTVKIKQKYRNFYIIMTGLWFSWSRYEANSRKSTNWTFFRIKIRSLGLPGHRGFFEEKINKKKTYLGNAMYKMIIHTKSWRNAILIITGI